MVCGRLARRTDSVMFRKGKSRREYWVTLPKPRFHLFCTLVNIVLEESVRSELGGVH